MSELKISVVICTYNPREDYLRRVLEGLRKQTLPAVEWELLLIDNASPDSVASRFDVSWHPRGKHIQEDEPGVTLARLRGIKESKADILVFVDDDAVLDPDYLEQALVVGEAWPFVGSWGGSALPEFEAQPPAWCLDHAWRLTVVAVKEDVWSNLKEGFLTTPYGAGLCVRRSVCQRFAERFNETSKLLDRKGTGLSGYGDIDLAHCALDIGLGTGISTRLHLTHLIRASRLTMDYFIRHAEGDAASLMMFRAIRGLPVEEPRYSFQARLKRFAHKLLSNKPREFFQIEDAHFRGKQRGWKMIQDYQKSKKTGQ